jgi:predicted DsbA family dithiol-disulfide isomerase
LVEYGGDLADFVFVDLVPDFDHEVVEAVEVKGVPFLVFAQEVHAVGPHEVLPLRERKL